MVETSERLTHRRHGAEFKAPVIWACRHPGTPAPRLTGRVGGAGQWPERQHAQALGGRGWARSLLASIRSRQGSPWRPQSQVEAGLTPNTGHSCVVDQIVKFVINLKK